MIILFRTRRKLPHQDSLLRLAENVCKSETPLRSDGEIGFEFVSDHEIRRINKQFLNHDYATDVITFPYPPQKNLTELAPFGDIYISIDTARRQAQALGHSTLQELALLIVHGLLHLCDYDDTTPQKQARMFARQKVLLRRWAPSLAPPDFR